MKLTDKGQWCWKHVSEIPVHGEEMLDEIWKMNKWLIYTYQTSELNDNVNVSSESWHWQSINQGFNVWESFFSLQRYFASVVWNIKREQPSSFRLSTYLAKSLARLLDFLDKLFWECEILRTSTDALTLRNSDVCTFLSRLWGICCMFWRKRHPLIQVPCCMSTQKCGMKIDESTKTIKST